MSTTVVNKVFWNRGIFQSSALIPWTPSIGRLMDILPRALPQGLVKKLEQRTKESRDDQDFFSNNGILLAVPKKKVSHQKKRQKLYGPGSKQLKMIHHLNKCPSCGHFKRANTLCMHCVDEVRRVWKSKTFDPPQEAPQERDLSDLDRRILYPGKKETEYEIKLKDKESYVETRMRTLPVSEKK